MLHIPFLDRTTLAVPLALSAVLALGTAAVAHAQTPDPPPPPPPAPPEVPPRPEVPQIPQVPQIPKLPKLPEVPDLPGTPGADGTLGGLGPLRLSPRLMLSARPRRERTLPVSVRLSGWLLPPMRLGRVAEFFRRSLGIDVKVCNGRVTIAFKANGRTVARRRASVTRACMFTSRITIRTRRGLGRARRLKATARFAGNDLLAPAQHSLTVHIGRR